MTSTDTQGISDEQTTAMGTQPEPELCPECDGSGETTVMSDGGPDAYEVPVCCPHCNGDQTLAAAYDGVVKLLRAEEKKYHECAAILFLGRADRRAADRLREIAEYVVKAGFSPEWARDRLMALADMAATTQPSSAPTPPAAPELDSLETGEGDACDPPMTLAQQVARARAEVATWPPERRANVQLEGSGGGKP